jgi:hypothetical protein
MDGRSPQTTERDWVEFPGGELEGQRPRALCPACREKLQARWRFVPARRRGKGEPSRPPICFQCYRAELERQRALKAAGELNTASEARFQFGLPFERVNQSRLEALRADRAVARAAMQSGPDRFVARRRQAQIAARHALQRVVAGLSGSDVPKAERDRAMLAATHAAELQLPEAWLPFVVAR